MRKLTSASGWRLGPTTIPWQAMASSMSPLSQPYTTAMGMPSMTKSPGSTFTRMKQSCSLAASSKGSVSTPRT